MNVAVKLEMLKTLDVDKALAIAPIALGGWKDNGVWAGGREVALAALHKARVRQPKVFNKSERAVSGAWLQENGWRL